MRAADGRRSSGLLMQEIQDISRQLLRALSFLHAAGVAHLDLKCTNVMLRDAAYDLVEHPRAPGELVARPRRRPCEAVLIDFGGAARPHAGAEAVTQGDAGGLQEGRAGARGGARHVRAPEIVLGLDTWDCGADLWSLATLLASLYTGGRLFHVHEDTEHLAAMERICEASIPSEMAAAMAPRVSAKGVAFDAATGRLVWPGARTEWDAVGRIKELPPLRSIIGPRHAAFLQLMQGLLVLRPAARLTAEEALRSCDFVAAGGPAEE
mmetsp:Transcript_20208/g.57161  ORF Transcript_20208/g.57161 Transcript_20208/m.57161 type:complete len:266 (+) Transcript_20208:3-800(+)